MGFFRSLVLRIHLPIRCQQSGLKFSDASQHRHKKYLRWADIKKVAQNGWTKTVLPSHFAAQRSAVILPSAATSEMKRTSSTHVQRQSYFCCCLPGVTMAFVPLHHGCERPRWCSLRQG